MSSELYFSLYNSRNCPPAYSSYVKRTKNGALTIDANLVARTAEAAVAVLCGNGLDTLVDAVVDSVCIVDDRRSDELDDIWPSEVSVALVRIGAAARGASENSLVALIDLAVSVGILVGLTGMGNEVWESKRGTVDVAQAWEMLRSL